MKRLIPLLLLLALPVQAQVPETWRAEFPLNAFDNSLIDLTEVIDGGPPRDGIPAIDAPTFVPQSAVSLAPDAPVISVAIQGQARAYPLDILIWHEIVNDTLAGVPIAVTYCPLCNAALVFERTLAGQVLDFGTTGRLRKSDLLMYDRQTETWWQQFEGGAVVGALAGQTLTIKPARLEGYASFQQRFPAGEVLAPPAGFGRDYGRNPYEGYDSDGPYPFFVDPASLPTDIAPMAYLVAVGNEAWTLEQLQQAGRLEASGLVLSWTPGARSALDSSVIAEGRDLGNVVVTRDGQDVAYDLTFAFVFRAFRPDGVIHLPP